MTKLYNRAVEAREHDRCGALLEVDTLLCMAAQIPARVVAEMGKDRVNAGVIFRARIIKLDFVGFLFDRIIASHRDLAELFAMMRDSVAKRKVVAGVYERQQCA